jgi:hypothetical protein
MGMEFWNESTDNLSIKELKTWEKAQTGKGTLGKQIIHYFVASTISNGEFRGRPKASQVS